MAASSERGELEQLSQKMEHLNPREIDEEDVFADGRIQENIF